jgi:hypothetical protein
MFPKQIPLFFDVHPLLGELLERAVTRSCQLAEPEPRFQVSGSVGAGEAVLSVLAVANHLLGGNHFAFVVSTVAIEIDDNSVNDPTGGTLLISSRLARQQWPRLLSKAFRLIVADEFD